MPPPSLSSVSQVELENISHCLIWEWVPYIGASYDSYGYGGGILTRLTQDILFYDRRSVGKPVLVSGLHVGPAIGFLSRHHKLSLDTGAFLIRGSLSDERVGL
jgi:hypothetical protein